MSKRHVLDLDLAASDDETNTNTNDAGYDSEAAEEQRSKNRAVKRRRTSTTQDLHGLDDCSDDNDSDANDESEEETTKGKSRAKKLKRAASASDNGDEDEDEDEVSNSDKEEPTTLTAKTALKAKTKKVPNKKKKKTGVVYLSSLPPYLKPMSLKSLIEQRSFSPVLRVFLAPMVKSTSAPRRASNKRKMYSEGWVEFASKKTAKICAETLNASIVGGRKGGWYHDDVWNMKYLRGFSWDDLMETVRNERSQREARQRIEDSRARKEDKVFLEGYERGKVIEGIQEKRRQKKNAAAAAAGGVDVDVDAPVVAPAPEKVRMVFKQSEVKHGRDRLKGDGKLADDTQRVLGKIF
ncbi:hypothetical protein BO70DRAFT_362863 [Aspergillus heteromorphus CBS 117.55]|uniref:Pre-rRNA-processing protein ESF2 n=1 Tax=Aspergillus heteromorphus CBS 117.55 TaxID=1448321 RepID=A0A317W398_9EURO|nr:uncharacterized protein BO70DRAFT_362863 [Aspergillus heteromorphus CBS 117.55]PWY79727.1 hypothetical protein BO70DRAFT_362863 [Aspergillus heteromorphus CBS 117.55]